jgi:hypothetical protein
VDAERHQIVHQIVFVGYGIEYGSDPARLIFDRHGFIAKMSGLLDSHDIGVVEVGPSAPPGRQPDDYS